MIFQILVNIFKTHLYFTSHQNYLSYLEASHQGVTEWHSKWQGAIISSEGRMLPSHRMFGQRSFAHTKRKIPIYLKVECLEMHWLFFCYKYQSVYHISQHRHFSDCFNQRINLIPYFVKVVLFTVKVAVKVMNFCTQLSHFEFHKYSIISFTIFLLLLFQFQVLGQIFTLSFHLFFGQPMLLFFLGYFSQYTVTILLGSIRLLAICSAVQFTKLLCASKIRTIHFLGSSFCYLI